MMSVVHLLFDPRGRIGRVAFWLALVAQTIFVVLSELLIVYFEFPAVSAGGVLPFAFAQAGAGYLVALPLLFPFMLLSAIGSRLELAVFRGYELVGDIGGGTAHRIDVDFFAINLLCLLPLLASVTAVGIKRLHDRGRSGAWLLLMYLVPVIFYMAPVMTAVAGWAMLLWPLVELGLLSGTPGPNKYGAAPPSLSFVTPAST
jgi:uncharacterized membrane protein YhaH (DUF805 family)